MPFTATAGYPSTVAGETASARKLQDSAPAANSSTIADFSTTTTRRKIQWKPATSNTASGTPGAATGFGYGTLKAEMNRTVDLPSKALISGGVWTFDIAFETSQADAVGAAAKIEAHVYKRSAAGTFTLLFSATMPTGVSVTLAGAKTATITSASQSAVTFETDETLHIELWVDAQGVTLSGNTYALNLGTGTKVSFPLITSQTEGILDHHPRSYSATGVGTAPVPLKWVRLAAKAATGIGTAPVPLKWARLAAKTATAVGVVPTPLKWTRLLPKSATAIGVVATPVKYVRLAAKTATAVGVATRQANWIRLAAKTATAIGLPTAARRIEAFRSFAATGVGTSAMTRAVIAVRTFVATSVGVATASRVLTLFRSFSAAAMGMVSVPVKYVRLAVKSATAIGMATASRFADLFRSFSAAAVGNSAMTRAVIAVRTFVANLVGLARGDVQMPFTALNRITTGGPADWSPNNGAKTISGVVRDATGTAYAGATVELIRESDGFVAATTISGADGSYSFTRDTNDPYTYRVLAWEDTGTPTQGVSARGLVPV